MAEAEVKEEVQNPSNSEVLTKYRTAGEIANDAIKAVAAMLKPGVKIVDACQAGDDLIESRTKGIYNKGKVEKGLAFPTCISINNVVGHFSPLSNNDAVIKAGDVVKIDLGVHIDGYPVVAAHTVIVESEEKRDEATAKKISNLMHATNTAMELALRKLTLGGKNQEVTAVLGKVAEKYGVSVVQGVLSHNMTRFQIDGEKVIISKSDAETRVDDVEFGLNEVWALDIVMSTGDGKPRQVEDRTTVFKRTVDTRYKLKLKASNYVITEVSKRFPYFPFSLRALDEKQGRLGIVECLNHGLVQDYPVLLEKDGEFVSHLKATALILSNGVVRVSSVGLDVSGLPSEVVFDDPELKSLLDKPLTKKKKKKSSSSKKKEEEVEE